MALLATLCLFTFLTAMITAVLKGNAVRRRYLSARRDYVSARNLAESGIHEALQRIAGGGGASSVHRAVGMGGYRTEWRRLARDPRVYEIVSVGVAREGDPASPRKAVQARVEMEQGPDGLQPRLVSWNLR